MNNDDELSSILDDIEAISELGTENVETSLSVTEQAELVDPIIVSAPTKLGRKDPFDKEELLRLHDEKAAEIYADLKVNRKQAQRVVDICYDRVNTEDNVKSVYVEQLVAATKTLNDITLGQVDVLNSKAKLLAAIKQTGTVNNNVNAGSVDINAILNMPDQ